MGYGGGFKESGKVTRASRDKGIDGVISQDKLRLELIHVQAKKWNPDNVVTRPEVQKFAGALSQQRSKKGIFITTSYFSQDAIDSTKEFDAKIILINGMQLAGYMIDYNLGVTTSKTFELKNIDTDYFEME